MATIGPGGIAPGGGGGGGGGGGDASASNQLAGNASLSSIDTKLAGLGQANMANSSPVVIASNQSAVPVSGPLTDAQLRATAVPVTSAGSATEATLAALNAKVAALGPQSVANSQSVSLALHPTTIGPSALTTGNNILKADNTGLDTSGYQSGLLVLVSTATGGTWIVEQSVDNVTWAPVVLFESSLLVPIPINSAVTATAGARAFAFANPAPFLRVRIATTLTGGSAQASVTMSQMSFASPVVSVIQNNAPNLAATVSGTVTASNAAGTAAHSAAASGNPVQVGGVVATAVAITEVAGDACRMQMTTGGQLVTKVGGLPETDVQFTGILTTNTATAAMAAGGASIRNYVTDLSFQNTNATATTLLLQDGAATIAQWSAPASMATPVALTFATPRRGTAATAMNLTCGTTGANVLVNLGGYRAP